ncbi:hypothetical protein IV203_026502 [Nitzschia inconspicua]|uniref:Uncharacterized protein n=1 Tax=Nitzschia inconspicua TaxID=303405 RepID=A0A9K3LJG4_9STRA|nr:hypothetical protein IV203_026502 [Nitzschia inconspicua]
MSRSSLSLCCLLVLCAAAQTRAFSARIQPLTTRSSGTSSATPAVATVFFAQKGEESYSDLPPEESTEYTGSVDWDAEWKKVVANEGKLQGGKERPGQGYYRSEAEIQAIKAANAASEKLVKAGSSVTNALPDFRSLSGDWRFWIAILALVSIGLSLLTAPQNVVSSGLQGDSYYI